MKTIRIRFAKKMKNIKKHLNKHKHVYIAVLGTKMLIIGMMGLFFFSQEYRTHAQAITHTITATADDNGTISPSGEVKVDEGASQTFTMGAAAGYGIKDVTVDGGSKGAVRIYNFDSVTAPHTIHNTVGELPRINLITHDQKECPNNNVIKVITDRNIDSIKNWSEGRLTVGRIFPTDIVTDGTDVVTITLASDTTEGENRLNINDGTMINDVLIRNNNSTSFDINCEWNYTIAINENIDQGKVTYNTRDVSQVGVDAGNNATLEVEANDGYIIKTIEASDLEEPLTVNASTYSHTFTSIKNNQTFTVTYEKKSGGGSTATCTESYLQCVNGVYERRDNVSYCRGGDLGKACITEEEKNWGYLKETTIKLYDLNTRLRDSAKELLAQYGVYKITEIMDMSSLRGALKDVSDQLYKTNDEFLQETQKGLLLRRPPGREAYPGDVFYLHIKSTNGVINSMIPIGRGQRGLILNILKPLREDQNEPPGVRL